MSAEAADTGSHRTGEGGTGGACGIRPLYLELCGMPGVGKSTLARALAEDLAHRRLYRRAKADEKARLFLAAAWAGEPDRLRAFRRLLAFLVLERRASGWSAFRRARFILASAARADFRAGAGGVLLLEEGPVSYLAAIGCHGERWAELARLLVPAGAEARFVFLAADRTELAARDAGRARGRRLRLGRTGREGIAAHEQEAALRFWYERLREAGGRCHWIDTSGRTPAQVHEALRAEWPPAGA